MQDEFEPMLDEIPPLPDAHDLLAALKRAGFVIALASSGPARYVEKFLALVDGERPRRCMDQQRRRRSQQARARPHRRSAAQGARGPDPC